MNHPSTHTHTHTHTTEELEIVIAPADSVADYGSTVLFTCVAYGIPPPDNIIWTLNDYTLYNDTYVSIYNTVFEVGGALFYQSILELCGVNEYFQGNYSCTAENNYSSISAYFQLFVQPLGKCVLVCMYHCYSGAISLYWRPVWVRLNFLQ